MAKLYLIPSLLAEDGREQIPPVIVNTLHNLRVFVVEKNRTARRFLRTLISDFPIDESIFIELDKHDIDKALSLLLIQIKDQKDIGLISEAGAPCIADPGAKVVNRCRERGYKICPLTGPSSIMLGLMASGMNGQEFTFHGYLPIKENELSKKLRDISRSAKSKSVTHIFIETPYRNNKLINHIKRYIDPSLYLSAAINLNAHDEEIITLQISNWTKTDIGKKPAIYCIGQLKK